jgi:hypothetical protein
MMSTCSILLIYRRAHVLPVLYERAFLLFQVVMNHCFC